MDVRGARNASRNRLQRKRKVEKYILDKVRVMKADIASIEIMEDVEVEQAPWATYAHLFRLN